jgi:cytochrome oxidase Cu insertion factor (SCO1/SenC/PrrC family)
VQGISSNNHSKNEEMVIMANIEVNRQAPDFEMEDFNGNEFKLSNFKGKKNILIVLNRGFV